MNVIQWCSACDFSEKPRTNFVRCLQCLRDSLWEQGEIEEPKNFMKRARKYPGEERRARKNY